MAGVQIARIAFFSVLFISPFPSGAYAEAEQIPVLLKCSALSVQQKKNPALTAGFTLTFANGVFNGERGFSKRPGKESFYGPMLPDGQIKITGRGAFYDSNSAWRFDFSGAVKNSDETVLTGMMRSLRRNATRNCSLAFLVTPARMGALLESVRPRGKERDQVAERQKSLEATREQLRRDQASAAANLAEKQKALEARQEQFKREQADAAAGLAEKQRALEAEQQNQKQQQAKTANDLKWVENVLGGIILPPTEDIKSWMMRVAAVPVQQQQFCRIIDRFYDNLAKVYGARNDIKKNALFRNRKEDMVTLLPRGEFSNWVVQIKEVTQAPDGSAAVMLQPPCRAMLGSDACQKNGSKIRATIQPNSSLYRELSQVSAGDFVVVSGKILYAESMDPNQPLPTYAVYQAGSHCSAIEESKHEDVFVTEVSYLVQLR